MEIAPCRTYHAITSSVNLIEMPHRKTAFKIYYLSIIGRDKPDLYEWEHCALTEDEFESTLITSGQEGIGFVTAFPHITKIFRFAPVMETVLDISEFDTEGLMAKDCSRDDGYHEFACYAEAVIAAEEYHAWAKAATVSTYLAYRCSVTDFPVTSNSKLAEFATS
jgi:hypothetical protein